MISPSELWAGAARGGRLAPFFPAVCVYFLFGGAGGAPTAGAAALKCAPVLCLLLCVLPAGRPARGPRGRYARWVGAGLALSALGDAALVWPDALQWGVGAFGAAHACYLRAFGMRPRRWRLAAPLLAGALLAGAVPAPGAPRPLLAAYALLLAAMTWRGAARPGAQRPGALLFLLSDAILGYSLFVGPVPYAHALVMSTYYLAQLGIALSALEPAGTGAPDPPGTAPRADLD